MEERLARFRLRLGLEELRKRRNGFRIREEYLRGEQKLPFAPEGVDEEYVDLQKQAMANYFQIAVNAPVQRLRADGIRTGRGDEIDRRIWEDSWQANRLDTRQTLIYRSMMLHSRGIVGVWPNQKEKARPIIRPESVDLVHVEPDPDDPFSSLWALKAFQRAQPLLDARGRVLPSGTDVVDVAVLYDAETFLRFEKRGGAQDYEVVGGGAHPMRRVPFALYDYRTDSQGRPWSVMDALIPQQDAINTIRFNTLLAMQFSAYRQRIVTGFDPRALDDQGRPLFEVDAATGQPILDPKTGAPIPILNSPGRAGVDRILAFPGGDTHVFDLPESNLGNYVEVLNAFLVQFFSTGQIPPQYLLGQMANLSGDALAGAESTLASLVKELQLSAGEGHESMLELAWHASGETDAFAPSTETQWTDAEARSFAQIVDAITKLIAGGFPKRDAWAMIPGATEQRLRLWMEHQQEEADASLISLAARPFVDVTPPSPAVGSTGNAPAPGQLPAAPADATQAGA
jgi:hypothetical protein